MSMPAKVLDPSDSIVSILRDVETDRTGLVQAVDKIMTELASKKLTYKMPIHPRLVGFDPANRGGEGGNAQAVRELASDIAEVGWAWSECAHAVCAEVTPNDQSVEDFNAVLSADCGLAAVESHSIKYGSLSCGHTNYALRCIAAGVESQCPLLSENGRMDLQKLESRDKEYASAVRNGLRWTVIRWEVRLLYPEVLGVVQSARNMTATLQRRESEIEGLLRLHGLSAAAQREKREVNWAAIKKTICRSRPPYAEILDDLISFLIARSGGVDGKFLKYLHAFHRTCVSPKRSALPGPVYAAIADFPHHFLAIALMEAAFYCPKEFVKGNTCTWLSATEVVNLGKAVAEPDKAKLLDAEASLLAGRTMLPAAGITEDVLTSNKLVMCLAKFDIAMARFVTGKIDSTKVKFTSVAEVGALYVQELAAAFPHADLTALKARFSVPVAPVVKPASDDKAKAPVMDLYRIDDKGRTVDGLALLRARGFDMGGTVASNDEPRDPSSVAKLFRIVGIVGEGSATAVKLVRLEGSFGTKASSSAGGGLEEKSVPLNDFFSVWALADAKSQEEFHPGWPACRTSTTDAAKTLLRKAAILTAMGMVASTLDKVVDPTDIAIYAKPTRKVVVTKEYAAGTFFLHPETTNVKAVLEGEPFEAGAAAEAQIITGLFPDQHKYYLMPCTGPENVSPFWCVGTTDDPERANMVMMQSHVATISGVDLVGGVLPAEKKRVRISKKDKALNPQQLVTEDVAEIEVMMPLMVNQTDLPAGTELLIFKKKVAKKVKVAEPISVTQLAKRAKTQVA